MSLFDLPGFRMDFERHGHILRMSPLEAARTWLDLEFGIGDETALCFAIRKEPRIALDNDALIDLAMEAMDFGMTPEEFLEIAIEES